MRSFRTYQLNDAAPAYPTCEVSHALKRAAKCYVSFLMRRAGPAGLLGPSNNNGTFEPTEKQLLSQAPRRCCRQALTSFDQHYRHVGGASRPESQIRRNLR